MKALRLYFIFVNPWILLSLSGFLSISSTPKTLDIAYVFIKHRGSKNTQNINKYGKNLGLSYEHTSTHI